METELPVAEDSWLELARKIGNSIISTPFVKRLDKSYRYETRGAGGCVRGLCMRLTENGPEIRIGLILNSYWIGKADFFQISKSISDIVHDQWNYAQPGSSVSVMIDIVDVDYGIDRSDSFSLPL